MRWGGARAQAGVLRWDGCGIPSERGRTSVEASGAERLRVRVRVKVRVRVRVRVQTSPGASYGIVCSPMHVPHSTCSFGKYLRRCSELLCSNRHQPMCALDGWDVAVVSPYHPSLRTSTPHRMQPSRAVSHPADARHRVSGSAQDSMVPTILEEGSSPASYATVMCHVPPTQRLWVARNAAEPILEKGSSLSPGKRLHHQRSSRRTPIMPLSDTSPTRKRVKMTEKRAETATPHLREAPEKQQQVEHEDAIGDLGKDGKRVGAGFETLVQPVRPPHIRRPPCTYCHN
jgi:hypothetical protein